MRGLERGFAMARILVVDDEQLVRATLRQMLEHAGHDILEAENGEAALETCDGAEIDLVITDILMPEKEGIETIIELRQQTPDLKIIAISGGDRGAQLDYLGMAERLGADSVLAKPFRRDQILQAVRDALA